MGQKVWALNGSYRYLMKHGIQPDAHIILDSLEENLSFLEPKVDLLRLFEQRWRKTGRQRVNHFAVTVNAPADIARDILGDHLLLHGHQIVDLLPEDGKENDQAQTHPDQGKYYA